MKQIEKSPIWVKLAYANVHTRKLAVIMLVFSVVFALYCVPWVRYWPNPLVAKIFLIDDWSWFISMIPLIAWYWLSLKWVDKHAGWES